MMVALRVWLAVVAGCLLVSPHLALAEEEDFDSDDIRVASAEVNYMPPKLTGNAYLAETFDGSPDRWVRSEAKKEGTDEDIAKYNGEWKVQAPDVSPVKGDVGLVLTTKARHAAISAKLDAPFKFSGKPLVVQYEVKFQNGMDCGGAYMKLLSDTPGLDLKQVTDKSGYTIMFGPDTCGVDKKLHFIMRHRNPKSGELEEKHAKKPTAALDFFGDRKTHLFRLTVRPDNEWEVHVDDALVNSGSLLEDMTPPVNPPAEIDDADDFKPADWDDKEKIPDPDATKPIDWDEDAPEFILDEEAEKPSDWLEEEEELIPDPSGERPDDWDDEMDGEWESPKIENPKCASVSGCGKWTRPNKRNPDYKGKWMPEMIANPNYSGVWAPRRIPNPHYFDDKQPYKMTPIGAVAFELWTMTDGVLFDNVLITDDEKVADSWTASTWHITRDAEMAEAAKNSPSVVDAVKTAMDEKPWLWAVLVVSLLIPIGLIFYCCSGGSKDEAAKAKKTDAPTADDADDKYDDARAGGEAVVEDEGAGGDTAEPSGGEETGDDDETAATQSSKASKSGRAKLSQATDDEDQEGSTADEAASSPDEANKSDGEARRTSPRKRKSRKE